ncbi:AbrB/MazE/SpoVT family DNA-binding domain-containing protein [Candidatus Viridilinea mediisalina]|uniref:AbrB/MazE/SpoVT family DNA-binding domain-containing protein n=1 Tax=Candidatus Viridilinea mediisalina TaxID=2024553 RepID=A0A2A6RIY9_9CHLR|nr:AbrB/MazE/SpoVT family DNA-binding domain-containing protein [Candidatus Viridilinea mediisalina]PDW02828.1 AbrB/MazE/SpoVT family DNA-binding domain-containing protein [Candidatus Viridilinea mediisalina]
MSTVMKTRLVKIGNSHGIRIPKVVRDQIGLTDTIELEVDGSRLIVRSSAAPRAAWAAQFRQMAERQDDVLLDADTPATLWDSTEWEWE